MCILHLLSTFNDDIFTFSEAFYTFFPSFLSFTFALSLQSPPLQLSRPPLSSSILLLHSQPRNDDRSLHLIANHVRETHPPLLFEATNQHHLLRPQLKLFVKPVRLFLNPSFPSFPHPNLQVIVQLPLPYNRTTVQPYNKPPVRNISRAVMTD
jgi:hypothetical protein